MKHCFDPDFLPPPNTEDDEHIQPETYGALTCHHVPQPMPRLEAASSESMNISACHIQPQHRCKSQFSAALRTPSNIIMTTASTSRWVTSAYYKAMQGSRLRTTCSCKTSWALQEAPGCNNCTHATCMWCHTEQNCGAWTVAVDTTYAEPAICSPSTQTAYASRLSTHSRVLYDGYTDQAMTRPIS